MPYHMDYAHIHVLMQITYFLSSYTNSMALSDISDFKDIMITSSNEDILAREDAPYWKDWFELNIILTLIYSIN